MTEEPTEGMRMVSYTFPITDEQLADFEWMRDDASYFGGFESVPLTRSRELKIRAWAFWYRLRDAWEVLRGNAHLGCDCEDRYE